jgi:hypothetical protein
VRAALVEAAVDRHRLGQAVDHRFLDDTLADDRRVSLAERFPAMPPLSCRVRFLRNAGPGDGLDQDERADRGLQVVLESIRRVGPDVGRGLCRLGPCGRRRQRFQRDEVATRPFR